MSNENKVSRRDFLKSAAVSMAGVSLAGMSSIANADNLNITNGVR